MMVMAEMVLRIELKVMMMMAKIIMRTILKVKMMVLRTQLVYLPS